MADNQDKPQDDGNELYGLGTTQNPRALDPSQPPEKFLGQIIDKATGFEAPVGDEITPTDSPVDWVAGAAGASLAKPLIRSAAPIVGNEIGSIGRNIAKPGMIELEHYSSQPNLKVIDPNKAGTGFDARIRGRSSEHPQSFFYEAGTPPEAESAVGSAPHKYKAYIPEDKVYDIGKDPENLVSKAIKDNNGALNMDRVHDAVKEAGYTGYRNSANDRLSNVVVSYEPLEAHPANATSELDKPHFLFTAENPVATPKIKASNQDIIKELQKEGFKADIVKGKYGKPENSIMVHDVTPDQAEKLHKIAADLGQESSIYSNEGKHEMRFHAGEKAGTSEFGEGTTLHEVPPEDFYTQSPSGKYFTHRFSSGGPVRSYADGGDVNPADPETEAAFQSAIDNPVPGASLAAPQQPMEPAHAISQAITDSRVNVINPEGNLVSIPPHQVQEAINSGYQLASDEHVADYVKKQTYGTPAQQALTALEGAGEAATFGASPLIAQQMGLTTAEDQLARQQVNPGMHTLGQLGGLGASMLTGVGEGAALARAGEMGAAALGLEAPATVMGKIGSAAVKGAIENSLFQAGDENAKMILKDPEQSVQTAAANIGLAGLLGAGVTGAIGAVNPLWHATVGAKVGGVLKALSDRAGGIEGVIGDDINKAIETSGMNIPPEVKAAFSQDPAVRQMFATLQESSTGSGLKAQEALRSFRTQVADNAVQSLGKLPQDVMNLSDLSEYEVGSSIKETLKKSLEETMAPITKAYEEVSSRFKATELPEIRKVAIANDLVQLAGKKGYNLVTDSAQGNLLQNALKDVQNLKTLEDLRKYISLIGDDTSGIAKQELWDVGKNIKRILRDAEDATLTDKIAADAPELMQKHALARSGYRQAINVIDDLNSRLHVGSYNGPGTFIQALAEMDGESVLRRLSPKNAAGLIEELQSRFPQVAEQVRDHQLNQILKNAAMKAGPNEVINPKALFSSIEKLSPEMRDFVVPKEGKAKLDSIKALVDALPAKMNPSGTAKTLDSLMAEVPGTATGMAAMLLGHNPAVAWVVSKLTGLLSRTAPDAVRLATLKFLGHGAPIESEAFKTAVDMIHATVEGNSLLNRATKSIFRAGQDVLPSSAMPSAKTLAKLDKQLLKAQTSTPEEAAQVGGKLGHYMPDQAQALAQTSANAVNYLNSLRPNLEKKAPLDSKPVATQQQKAQFTRALTIAQQPLSVLPKVKDGSITPNEIMILKNLYPSLYSSMASKMMDEMTATLSKGNSIPYTTRMGMSLFTGQAMDSTMTPQGIMGAQPKPPQQQQPSPTQPKSNPKHSMNALNKLPNQFKTSTQSAEQDRAGRRQ